MAFSLKRTLKKLDPSRLLKPKLPGLQDYSPLNDLLEKGGVEQRGLINDNQAKLQSLADALAARQQGLVASGGTEQRSLISGIRPQLNPLGDQFRSGSLGAAQTAQSAAEGRNKQYLGDVLSGGQDLEKAQSAALQRDVLAAQPELQQQLRESLAGTVGLRGGAASRGAQRLATQAQAGIESGQEAINRDALARREQARLGALESNRGVTENLAQQALGIDLNTLQAIYSSGRQDLINEANALLSEAQGRTNALTGIEGQRGTTGLAAQDQATQQLLSESQGRSQGKIDLGQLQREQQQARDIAKYQNSANLRNTFLQGGLQFAGSRFGGASAAGSAAKAAPAAASLYGPGSNFNFASNPDAMSFSDVIRRGYQPRYGGY